MSRNHSVDVLRFWGAFAVIVIHIGFTTPPWEAQIRLIARFAVPFFLIASGYFFEGKYKVQGKEAFASTLSNLAILFLSANLIFLPLHFIVDYLYGRSLALPFSSFFLGTWFHLWFLGSLIVGFLVHWIFNSFRLEKFLLLLSILCYSMLLLSEAYSFLGFHLEMAWVRIFLSVPLLYVGRSLARQKIEEKEGLLFFSGFAVISVALHVGETLLLYYIKQVPIGKMQFFITTPLMAISFFCLSLKVQTPQPTLISEWGRKYALMIYLYHPLILLACPRYHAMVPRYLSFLHWMAPVVALILTFLPILLIEKYLPKVYRVMSGKPVIKKIPAH